MDKKTIVHCITNYVSMDFMANSLLAVGATPLMSFCKEEMADIVSKCDALLVNIGCLDMQQIDAMKCAVEAAAEYGKKWVLDPVGAQFTDLRMETCLQLINIFPPTVVKGNEREINALEHILQDYDGVVVRTGETDLITCGQRSREVHYGSELMTLVTAMGCSAGAVIAAFLDRYDDAFDASVAAMTLFGKAGESAAKNSAGTGSFKMNFIDELYRLSSVVPCN